MAYEINGSVYFDVEKYNRTNRYGILSGRVLEDLLANTRELEGQGEKRFPFDFALWKKASPEHIMRWPSPWSEGFPGWHLECSVMSSKYLGQVFDIHRTMNANWLRIPLQGAKTACGTGCTTI